MKTPTKNSDLSTMVSSLNSFVQKGYTEDYKALKTGLKALKTGKIYQPDEVVVVDFYRFEGTSDPGDESILYAIETTDCVKGTLVDAYGPSSDSNVTTFMQQVEEISKNTEVKKGNNL